MEIGRHHAFRVTRNADLDLEESEADDLLAQSRRSCVVAASAAL